MTTSKKDRLNNFLNEKILPKMGKIGAQKHLSALRDGFGMFVPLVIVGAIALIFITFVLGGWGTNKTSIFGWISNAAGFQDHSYSHLTDKAVSWTTQPGSSWATFQNWGVTMFSWVNAATIGSISIYVSIFIGFSLSITKGYNNPILGSAMSLASFIILIGGDTSKFGATGMLTSVIASLVSVEIFTWLIKTKKMEIKMPPGVPPAISKSFAVLFPAILTGIAMLLVNVLFALPYYYIMTDVKADRVIKSFGDIIILLVQAPFIDFARSGGDIGILMVYVIGVNLLFFFGIHGPNTLNGLFTPIATLLWIDNMSGGTNVFTDGTYNGFVFLGGTGSTLPLLIGMILFLKKGSPSKEVAKYAIPSGIFEINEPALFGIPIVFNFVLFIPFLLGSLLAATFVTFAIKTGWMSPHTIAAPWTTPPIIYGLLATGMDWRSIFVSIINMGIIFAVYLPFIFLIRKNESLELEQKDESKTVQEKSGGNK